MEYAEAINEKAADRALGIALRMLAERQHDLRKVAARAVATAYCVCVTDGEDAAEHRFSRIHAQLISDLERRLVTYAAEREDK